MLEPLKVVTEKFRYHKIDNHTRVNIECFLEEQYSEAGWEVAINDDKMVVTIKFKTPQEETFYRLKWS